MVGNQDELDVLKRQGQRTDLTSRPVGEKLLSVDQLSNETPDSARQIHRYIRLPSFFHCQSIAKMTPKNGNRIVLMVSKFIGTPPEKILLYFTMYNFLIL